MFILVKLVLDTLGLNCELSLNLNVILCQKQKKTFKHWNSLFFQIKRTNIEELVKVQDSTMLLNGKWSIQI